MSKPLLESFVATADLLVRVFAILAALSAIFNLFSNWQLQKTRAQASTIPPPPEPQHVESNPVSPQSQADIGKLKDENASLAAQLRQEQRLAWISNEGSAPASYPSRQNRK